MSARNSIVIILVVAAGLFFWFSSREEALAVRTFEFTYLARIPELPAGSEGLRLWIPLPPSDEHQTISNLTIESPLPFTREREPEFGNQYIFVQAPPEHHNGPVEVQLRFRVTRREHRVSVRPTLSVLSAQASTTGEFAHFLQPNRLVPLDGMIGALSQQETRGLQEPLAKARAIYNYVVSTMRYDKSGDGWGRGDAVYACNTKRGNCTDFHSLFIGMIRAAGIPARFEIGFPLPGKQTVGEIPGYHCWAQFYLDGVGWIPVDASEAWKNPAQRDYFFGAHDQHRVLFTTGRDIRLAPPQQGEPLNYFIYPYAEVDGKEFTGIETRFSFRDLPAPPD